jgi:hypothetical protein
MPVQAWDILAERQRRGRYRPGAKEVDSLLERGYRRANSVSSARISGRREQSAKMLDAGRKRLRHPPGVGKTRCPERRCGAKEATESGRLDWLHYIVGAKVVGGVDFRSTGAAGENHGRHGRADGARLGYHLQTTAIRKPYVDDEASPLRAGSKEFLRFAYGTREDRLPVRTHQTAESATDDLIVIDNQEVTYLPHDDTLAASRGSREKRGAYPARPDRPG